MRLFAVRLAVFASAIVGCGETRRQVDESSIYNAVVRNAFASFDCLVVSGHTTIDGYDLKEPDDNRWQGFRDSLATLKQDTYQSFWRENQETQRLKWNEGPSGKQMVVLDADAFRDLASTGTGIMDMCRRFEARYPGGTLFGVSAVGTSEDGRQALVYVRSYTGGSGTYYLLQMSDERWRVVNFSVTSQD